MEGITIPLNIVQAIYIILYLNLPMTVHQDTTANRVQANTQIHLFYKIISKISKIIFKYNYDNLLYAVVSMS